jgi:hypothetical protein
MIIEIGEKKFENIPEDYSEMNVAKLIEVTRVKERGGDLVELISALIGCDRDLLESMFIEDVNALLDAFNWIMDDPDKTFNRSLVIDGITYVCKQNHLLTWGEQISIESFLKDKISNVDNFHLVLAILYRPGRVVGNNYIQDALENDFQKVIDRANLFMEKMMVSDISGVLDFFSNGAGKSITMISAPSSTLKIVRSKNMKA